jgi:protein arginine kinase activator
LLKTVLIFSLLIIVILLFLPYLKRVHGSIEHSGKTPDISEGKSNSISDLKDELNRLVKEEKYEQAAVIRDKIKELEEKGNE